MVKADYFEDYRNLPDYYDTMWLDGFTPDQILTAAHKTMLNDLMGPEDAQVNITGSVEVD